MHMMFRIFLLLLLQCLFSSRTLYFQAPLQKVLSAISLPLARQQFLKKDSSKYHSQPLLLYLKPFLYLAHSSFKQQIFKEQMFRKTNGYLDFLNFRHAKALLHLKVPGKNI